MQHPREKCVAVLEAFLAMLTKDEVAGLLAQMEGVTALLAGAYRQHFGFIASSLSRTHKRTGMPRSRIRSLACCTVYSP